MRVVLLMALIAILLARCGNETSEDQVQDKGSQEEILKGNILEYVPNSIDLSQDLDSLLSEGDLEDFYGSKDSLTLDSITNMVLLKLYLFHLKRPNQGYALGYMSKGNAKPLIDYFIYRNNLSTRELVTSGVIYNLLKENKLSGPYDENIVDSIDLEGIRIKEWLDSLSK